MSAVEDRFWSKVDMNPHHCWEWLAGKSNTGYGTYHIKRDGRWATVSAHRYSYEMQNGLVPQGLVVRHSCHNRLCVRPDHLSIGTMHDNSQDMVKAGRGNIARTECRNGHPYIEGSWYWYHRKDYYPGRRFRVCKVCMKINNKNGQERRKNA